MEIICKIYYEADGENYDGFEWLQRISTRTNRRAASIKGKCHIRIVVPVGTKIYEMQDIARNKFLKAVKENDIRSIDFPRNVDEVLAEVHKIYRETNGGLVRIDRPVIIDLKPSS
jgi:hypothetical protein